MHNLACAMHEIHLNWSKAAASSLWVQKVTAAASCSRFSCLSSQNSSQLLQAPIIVLFLSRDTAPTHMNTSPFIAIDNKCACVLLAEQRPGCQGLKVQADLVGGGGLLCEAALQLGM